MDGNLYAHNCRYHRRCLRGRPGTKSRSLCPVRPPFLFSLSHVNCIWLLLPLSFPPSKARPLGKSRLLLYLVAAADGKSSTNYVLFKSQDATALISISFCVRGNLIWLQTSSPFIRNSCGSYQRIKDPSFY